MITFLTYVTFALFSLGQLGRVSLFSASIYLYEIALVPLVLLLVFRYRLKPFREFLFSWKITVMFIVYLIISFLISIPFFSLDQNLVAHMYLKRLMFYYVFFIYFYFHISQKHEKRKTLTISYLLLMILVLTTSWVQYLLYPDLRNLFYLGWDPHLFRLFGTFLEPVILSTVTGLLLLYLYMNQHIIKNRYVRWGLMIILTVTILFTYARIVYIATLVTAALLLGRRHLKLFMILVTSFILVAVILPKPFGEGVNLLRTSTIESRAQDYEEGIRVWQAHPLFGIGFNHIPFVKQPLTENPDIQDRGLTFFQSSFISILVTGGILGLLLYLASLYELSRLNFMAMAGIFFAGVISLADNILLHPFVLFLLFTLICDYSFNLSRTSR